MDKPRCNLCDTKHWPSEGHKFPVKDEAIGLPAEPIVIRQNDLSGPDDLKRAVEDIKKAVLADPRVCPTCGRKRPMTASERQKRYRLRARS